MAKAKIIKEKQMIRDIIYIRKSDPNIEFLPDDQHVEFIRMFEENLTNPSLTLASKLINSKMIEFFKNDNTYKLTFYGSEYLNRLKELRVIQKERSNFIEGEDTSLKLRILRKRENLSVVKFASKVNLNPEDILNIEGQGKCDLEHLEIICNAYNIDFFKFLTTPIPKEIKQKKFYFTDSEIEEILLSELLYRIKWNEGFQIETQKDFKINKIFTYRVDFLITYTDKSNNKYQMIVECDGHNYHERTINQAKKDKRRDRYFLSIGIPTIRFTGSEINEDCSECALDVFNTLWSYAQTLKKG